MLNILLLLLIPGRRDLQRRVDALWRRWRRHRKKQRGKITLNPGIGAAKIRTHFPPLQVQIEILNDPDFPVCVDLQDKVEVSDIDGSSFELTYDIKSGPLTIFWVARGHSRYR